MKQIAFYDAILEACGLEGCPLCRIEHAADLRYFERLFYERVNDYALRVHLRASVGFCHEHAQIALHESRGNALGLAIIYDDLLRVALEQIDQQRAIPQPQKKCPACENREENNALALTELSKSLAEPALQTALRGSHGLCFLHFRLALGVMRDPSRRKLLTEIQRGIMLRLRTDLAEYIRKNDYRFMNEPPGDERDAWIRAVRLGKRQ